MIAETNAERLVEQLGQNRRLELQEYQALLETRFFRMSDAERKTFDAFLFERAVQTARQQFQNRIYIRGLIEFTNYCKNNCYYCGIRRDNEYADRYRLTVEEILLCCREGYKLGYRTFVLQGGEDGYYTDDRICEIVSSVKRLYPDCAVTLSIGEKSAESYRRFYEAGADRYLLRHETADAGHYAKLHPKEMSFENRRRCLSELKAIGYQVGAGFMVGSPGQTVEYLAEDLKYLEELRPHMIGIGPYIVHNRTPLAGSPNGSVEQTLVLIGILRLMFPKVLLSATTALGTLAADGRERGILAGANVIMPNLSPVGVRKKYSLYENKICTGEESAQCMQCIRNRMKQIGYEIVVDRGDYPEL